MADRTIEARLELIAAKARILVDDYRRGRLWEGELSAGLDELRKEINAIETNDNNRWSR